MLLTQPSPLPTCPNCGKPLLLARAIPPDEGVVGLHTYECKDCHLALTQAAIWQTDPRPSVNC